MFKGITERHQTINKQSTFTLAYYIFYDFICLKIYHIRGHFKWEIIYATFMGERGEKVGDKSRNDKNKSFKYLYKIISLC